MILKNYTIAVKKKNQGSPWKLTKAHEEQM